MYIPGYEKAIIFGAKWLRTEWKSSRQLVWAIVDAFWIPDFNLFFVNAFFTFSYTTDSKRYKG
jgi:hypothetical protein